MVLQAYEYSYRHPDFWSEDEELFEDRRVVSKLIYVTLTRPGIAFVVGLVSQFMHKPKKRFAGRHH